MFLEEIRHCNPKTKTILILAECWSGAMDAGRFAAQMLFDEQTQIILLNTYERHRSGVSMMRSLTSILEKAAKEDLILLKDTLINEYGISACKIKELSCEGDLISILQSDFSKYENLSVVLGQNLNNPYRKGFCREVINYLLSAKIRPVFMVSNFITLVESSRIILIAEKEENISSLYSNYLTDSFESENKQLEVVTSEEAPTIKIDPATARQLSDQISSRKQSMNNCEHLLYDLIKKSVPD